MTAVQTSAREFFRAAYDNRYTWEPSFPGYTADVTYQCGDVEFHGKAKVSPDPRMGYKGEVTGIEDADVLKAVQGQLWETAIHRVRRDFEQTHAENTFRFGETKADGAVELLMGGKSEGDRYEVKENQVSFVHRHMHGTVVTIHTHSSHNTSEGYLSHKYDSVYSDPKTGDRTSGVSLFEDEYEKIEGYLILTRRAISSEEPGQPTAEFLFSNIELLK